MTRRFCRDGFTATAEEIALIANKDHREAFELTRNAFYHEVSEQLQVPVGTIKSRVNRAKLAIEQLRKRRTALASPQDAPQPST